MSLKKPPFVVGGKSNGNRLKVFNDGDESFEATLDAIEKARFRVWMEIYILEPDAIGLRFIEALVRAAKRGCDVLLLFDRFGSPRINMRHCAPIWEAGGRVIMYNPLFPWRKIGRKIAPYYHRDHRKIFIVDDVGFCGGRNISIEYSGRSEKQFYDLTLQLEGPCVRDLATVLRSSVYFATHQVPALPPAPPPIPEGIFVDVLELNARSKELDLDIAIKQLIEGARHRCYLATPYFTPPRWMLDAVLQATDRGVDLRILTAGVSDVPYIKTAGRQLYGKVLAHGGRVYEMQQPIMHAKYLTVDGIHSIVGSYNIDTYGSRRNLEVAVATDDPDMASILEAEFHHRVQHSTEINQAAWQNRSWVARLLQWLFYQSTRLF